MSTHTGTHCDAPFHFFDDGKTIDEIPLETYVGPATILDLREKQPGSSIQRDDITRFTDRIEPGGIVLLNTGVGIDAVSLSGYDDPEKAGPPRNGIASPAYYAPQDDTFLRLFFGG